MTLEAQKRRDNNTVHVYEQGDSNPLCTSNGQPRRNPTEEVFELEEDDMDEVYLIRDENVIGKLCGRCRNAYHGTVGQ